MTHIKTTLLTQQSTFSSIIPSYQVPKQYIDCRKLVQQKLFGPSGVQKKHITTRQRQKFKKNFFLDQTIASFKDHPSPNKYLQTYSTMKRYKSVNTFITTSKQDQKNLGKRPTWIQDIEKYQQKYKPPTVGKYNLLTKSDFAIKKKSHSLQQLLKRGTKFNNLDDTIFVSAEIPGPGQHNPHKEIPKLKVNMLNAADWKKKHKIEEDKQKKKLNSSSVSSCSYSPVKDKTFDSFTKIPKRDASLMKIVKIQKRKGLSSQQLSPGPGAHNVLHKWGTQTFSKQKLIGKLHLFDKTTRSFPTLKIYH